MPPGFGVLGVWSVRPLSGRSFARKSVRGFFHDYMSNGADGSILDEHTISINFGLCRWAQYINVLSDATTCDPGSIIAMAGQLGYEACGAEVHCMRHPRPTALKPPRQLWRQTGSLGDPLFNPATAVSAR